MMKVIRKTGEGVLIKLTSLTGEENEVTGVVDMQMNILKPLQLVTRQFAGLFKMPSRLHPLRSKQHQITLTSVRPY